MNLPARVFKAASTLQIYKSVAAQRRRGFSLVEVMVATAISLILIGGAATLFGYVGDRVTAGRAGIETSDHVRAAQDRLRSDLQMRTATMLPWESPAAGNGYFEIVKSNQIRWDNTNYNTITDQNGNPVTGRDTVAANPTTTAIDGYGNDYLFFTIRAKDRPFVGRAGSTTVQSQVAEVVWFMAPNRDASGNFTNPLTYTLYRRMLLVLPGMQLQAASSSDSDFFTNYDISAHYDNTSGKMVANSLADLTYRENRFSHQHAPTGQYPFLVGPTVNNAATVVPFASSSSRFGDDVMLTNVLGFDVKVWDPLVPVMQDPNGGSVGLVPSDPGYNSNGTAIGLGAYVDLNYSGGKLSSTWFSNSYCGGGAYAGSNVSPIIQQPLATGPSDGKYPLTWDSWSAGYEYYNSSYPSAAYGQPGNAVSGFDNNSNPSATNRGVCNAGMRETSPPYPVPLRGVQIKIRVYEPIARQVREVTVDESFLPD